MKRLVVIIICSLTILNLSGQTIDTPNLKKQGISIDIQKNALYTGTIALFYISGFYERIIPAGSKSAFITGGGILQGFTWSDDTNILGKAGYIVGGTKHFFECGTLLNIIRTSNSDVGRILPLIAYRYQNEGGFLFRIDITANIVKDVHDVSGEEFISVMPGPGISIGYSF